MDELKEYLAYSKYFKRDPKNPSALKEYLEMSEEFHKGLSTLTKSFDVKDFTKTEFSNTYVIDISFNAGDISIYPEYGIETEEGSMSMIVIMNVQFEHAVSYDADESIDEYKSYIVDSFVNYVRAVFGFEIEVEDNYFEEDVVGVDEDHDVVVGGTLFMCTWFYY